MIKSTSFVSLVLALAACSDSGGKDSVGIDDLVDELRDAECNFEVRCEAVPDAATCTEALAFDSTEVLTTIADVKAGLVAYDDKLAAACVNAFAKADCSLAGITTATQACAELFQGTVATGGACVIDAECVDHGNCQATDDTCDSSTACCAGTCLAGSTQTPIGGACTASTCVDGAFCDLDQATETGTCKAQIATEGTACAAFDACKAPLQCDLGFGGGGSGTCKTLPAEGETCDTGSLFPCSDVRDYCDPASTACTHRAAVGEACGSNGVDCVGYAGCEMTTQKCVARPSLGDACDDSSAGNCLGSLDCVDGTCTGAAPGMDCSSQ